MRSIIYIERNNLYFYGSNVHAPIAFPFQPTVLRDIEVIDADELIKQLNVFITNNKIEPTQTIIVLAHQSAFEKTLPPKTDPAVIESEKKKFLENVPFEEILSKVYTYEKGTKIIAANKELTYLIRDIFVRHGFTVEIIASITPLSPDTDITFSAASAQEILKKASLLKQYGFPVVEISAAITDHFEEGFVQERKNMNLYIMLGVLFVGLAVLVFLLMSQRNAPKNTKVTTSPTPQRVSARIGSTPTPAPTTAGASPTEIRIEKNILTIQIVNGSAIAGQTDSIRTALESAGYRNFSTGNAQSTQTANSLILYKPRVSPSQRSEISQIVSGIAGNVATQENNELDVDILISTSRGT